MGRDRRRPRRVRRSQARARAVAHVPRGRHRRRAPRAVARRRSTSRATARSSAASSATAESAVSAYYELVLQGSPFTNQYGHHLWVIGLLVFATSLFAAYATFGHRRPLNAVVIIGVALVINMSLTTNNQLGYLVLYSAAAMFLLIRFHALDERAEWLRRRIGDPAAISGIYLRGGSMFIVLAVLGSLLLTTVAASKPLAGAWDGVSDNVVEVSRSLAKFLPGGANSRNLGSEFGDDTQIRGFWVDDERVYATIEISPDEDGQFYWRAVDVRSRSTTTAGPRRRRPISRNPPTIPARGDARGRGGHRPDPAGDVHREPGRVQGRLHPLAATAGHRQPDLDPAGHRPGRHVRRGQAKLVVGPVHGDGRRADPGRGRSRVEPAHRGRDRLSRGDPRDLPPDPGERDGTPEPRAPGRDGRGRSEWCGQLAVRTGQDDGDPVPERRVHLQDQRPGPAVRGTGPVDGRVLLDLQGRLLPVLRDDHGDLPAQARYPVTHRRGLPARQPRDPQWPGDPARPQPPPVGRGLLPELRLGAVRPDRWRASPCSDRCRPGRRWRAGRHDRRRAAGRAVPPSRPGTRSASDPTARAAPAFADRAAARRPVCSVPSPSCSRRPSVA